MLRMLMLRIVACVAMVVSLLGYNPASSEEQGFGLPTLKPGFSADFRTAYGSYTETLVDANLQDPTCPQSPCSKWILKGVDERREVAREVHLDAWLNPYWIMNSGARAPNLQYLVRYKFPAQIGASWTNDFVNSGGTTVHETVRVVGVQKIHVAGQDYTALHFHMDDDRVRSQDPRLPISYSQDDYYVEGLGIVKRDQDNPRADRELHTVLLRVVSGG